MDFLSSLDSSSIFAFQTGALCTFWDFHGPRTESTEVEAVDASSFGPGDLAPDVGSGAQPKGSQGLGGLGIIGIELPGRDGLKSLISSKKQGGFLEKIVLEAASILSAFQGDILAVQDELTERLQWTTNSLVNAKKNGTPYRLRPDLARFPPSVKPPTCLRHLLLHGPPGTGKTLFARTLARQSGQEPINKSITTSPQTKRWPSAAFGSAPRPGLCDHVRWRRRAAWKGCGAPA